MFVVAVNVELGKQLCSTEGEQDGYVTLLNCARVNFAFSSQCIAVEVLGALVEMPDDLDVEVLPLRRRFANRQPIG